MVREKQEIEYIEKLQAKFGKKKELSLLEQAFGEEDSTRAKSQVEQQKKDLIDQHKMQVL